MSRRSLVACVAPLAFFAGAILPGTAAPGQTGGTVAAAPSDTTLALTQRLLRRAVTAAMESPLSENPDAGEVITAMRFSHDPDLVPLFQKLRRSKALENQVYAMAASAILSKQAGNDPDQKDNQFDLKMLFSSKDQELIGRAISGLIDEGALSTAQLREIATGAPDASQRTMAVGELNRLKKLQDRSLLQPLLKDDKAIVRYYTAITMLSGNDPQEQKTALAALMEMSAQHDLRHAPVQALMLVRMQKEKIAAALPWAVQLAADEKSDEGLRYTAVTAALVMGAPEAPAILADMLQKQKDTIQQVKLGLISVEFAGQLKREALAPLLGAKASPLVKSLGALAQKVSDHSDGVEEFIRLIKEGHPIVLDWAVAYADRAAPERRLALRAAVVEQATIVDNERGRDYDRAVLAAQKILDEDGDAGRLKIVALLNSPNRAAVEATLAGIYRSDAKNQAALVSGVWDRLTTTTSMEVGANFAALILAREGDKRALTWLPGMVLGGTSQGQNFRALAGWYCAKLKGQEETLLKAILAD